MFRPASKQLKTATEVITINSRTGEIIARQLKDVATGEEQKVIGKGTGEAKVLLKSVQSKMPGVESVVKELDTLARSATYTKGGQLWDEIIKQTGQEPREAAIARSSYISKVKLQILPMLRDTFGAQFTVAEGESLLSTMGDPNSTPEEKQVVLRNFIEQKRRDIEALASETGQGGGGDQDQEGDTATGPNGEKNGLHQGGMGAAMTTLPPGFTRDKKAGGLPPGFVRDQSSQTVSAPSVAAPASIIPTMLQGMESPAYGPGRIVPAKPSVDAEASAMNWFRGGKTEAQIQDEEGD